MPPSKRRTYPAEGDGVSVRLACCVPHCGRTFRQDKKETPWSKGATIMCGKHWRTAPADLRARDKRLRRVLRNVDRLKDARKRYRLGSIVVRWINQNFERAMAVIIERAMGIG